MLSVHDIILIMQWDIFLNGTVRKDLKYRHFIAYYIIGGSLVYIGGARSK